MNWKKKLISITALASFATFIIHIINKLIYFLATMDNLLSNTSGSYYNWKFGKIYYKKIGIGHPLLLLHDLDTYSSGHEWNKVLKDLSKTNTVYRVDLLGCGRSDKPNITYTNYLYVQLINDFIKQVIGEETDILATGESGAFAIAACHNNNLAIRKLILVNPPDIDKLAKIPDKRSKLFINILQLPVIGTFIYNLLTGRINTGKIFNEHYFYDSNLIEHDLLSTYYETAHMEAGSKYLFASLYGHYTTINLKHCLKTITNSIYFIIGSEKENIIETTDEYHSILPSIEIEKINETKQLPQLEKPYEFMDKVRIFLEDEF
jgi:Predicted hydrolases or acyltransferases (alpha/beta hydrolase superfamily)